MENSNWVQAAQAYLPEEWCEALAAGVSLPEQTSGAALFADISGFTPLTEALTLAFGLRRGAEELPRYLNQIYDALVKCVHRFGGSVISFAGDAITCWFDDQLPAACPAGPRPGSVLRASAAALEMQAAMRAFASVNLPGRDAIPLAVKISVAAGPARRFVMGDPAIQRIPALFGDIIDRVAAGEHLAARGEVLVDETAAQLLSGRAQFLDWRQTEEGEKFVRLEAIQGAVPETPWDTSLLLREDQVRPWLLPPVYERLQSGLGEFLTEMRPVSVLFLRFRGFDFERDPAVSYKLDTYICAAQQIVAHSGGALAGVIIGDKGSYLYAVWGAPVAHEDDPYRAVTTALALLELNSGLEELQPVQIGVSQGTVRAGAYGSQARRTYGVLGDDVNLAARLMNRARPGEVWISERSFQYIQEIGQGRGQEFHFEPRPPEQLKGKAEPLAVFSISGMQQRRSMRLPEPGYTLPMVGRQQELSQLEARIDQALAGRGQVVGITAEAGMGKSRLVAEVIRAARRKGLNGFGGACLSDGTNVPYLVWSAVFRAIFDIDPAAPARRQLRQVERTLEDYAPDRVEALPLLGPLLGLPVPENEFTEALEPQQRSSALTAALLDCLKGVTEEEKEQDGGLLLVLEDCHWIDPASNDLLDAVATALRDLPVLLVLSYRPLAAGSLKITRLETLPYFCQFQLGELSPAEAEQALRAKLTQLYPEWRGTPPKALIQRVIEHSEGNPFFAEEILKYLHDQGIDLRTVQNIQSLELPASIHSLILSRIDQLTLQQQLTMKVASIIGRTFRFSHLRGYYPELGSPDPVKADLMVLSQLELTPLDLPEPELIYLFCHLITHEVAYENLPTATRTRLHEFYARYLEQHYQEQQLGVVSAQPLPDQAAIPYLDLLAYHYERSDNLPKKRLYLRLAGQAAAARYANAEARAYLTRALELLPEDDPSEQWAPYLAHEQVLDRLGEREAQAKDLQVMERLAAALDGPEDISHRVQIALRQASYLDQTGACAAAAAVAQAALDILPARSGEQAAALFMKLGSAQIGLGELSQAEETLHQALEGLPPGPHPLRAGILSDLGIIHAMRGEMPAACSALRQGLEICEQTHDLSLATRLGNNLGLALTLTGEWTAALDCYARALDQAHRIGHLTRQAELGQNRGLLYLKRGEYDAAQHSFEDSLALGRQSGHWEVEVASQVNLASVALRRGNREQARQWLRAAEELSTRQDGYYNQTEFACLRAELALAENQPQEALQHANQALELAHADELDAEAGAALREIGQAYAALGQLDQALAAFEESADLLAEADTYECARTQAAWGAVLLSQEPERGQELLGKAQAEFKRLGVVALTGNHPSTL